MVAVMDVPQNETQAYGIVTPGKDNGQLVESLGWLKNQPQHKLHQTSPSLVAILLNRAYLANLTVRTAVPAVKFS